MSLWPTIRAFFTAGKGVFGGLSEVAAGEDPLALFHTWFQEAIKAGIYLPESMALGTATPDGKPSVRLVLLKGYDERGFVFYTNYGSRKAAGVGSQSRGYSGVSLGHPPTTDPPGRPCEADLLRGIHGIFPEPGPGKPDRGLGVGAKRPPRHPGNSGKPGPGVRREVQGGGRSFTPLLGWVPVGATIHGVLAGPGQPPPRQNQVHPYRNRVGSPTALPLKRPLPVPPVIEAMGQNPQLP